MGHHISTCEFKKNDRFFSMRREVDGGLFSINGLEEDDRLGVVSLGTV